MSNTTFDDTVVIVTGSGSGIGAATATRLAQQGASVGVFDLNEDAAQHVAEGIRDAGGKSLACAMDVSKSADWERAVADMAAEFGRIDGLVSNAGVTRDKTISKMAESDWDLVINVNLKGAWLGAQHVIPHMKEHGGAIVNLSSESQYGEFGQTNYASAKAGITGLTRTLALELSRYQIRCNAVAPGSVNTPMTKAVPKDIRESWLDSIPLHRLGEPEEVAAAISFLLSSDASYVTGQILGVNGGSSR
jgi:3-oxoacyl-[acyl-carrier protein] reductase